MPPRRNPNMPSAFKSANLNIMTLDIPDEGSERSSSTAQNQPAEKSPKEEVPKEAKTVSETRHAAKPQPFPPGQIMGGLQLGPSPSPSGTKMPMSFQGFDMKTDPDIRRQAKKSWFDLRDDSTEYTPFTTQSPFEGINQNPAFPPSSGHVPATSFMASVEKNKLKEQTGERSPEPSKNVSSKNRDNDESSTTIEDEATPAPNFTRPPQSKASVSTEATKETKTDHQVESSKANGTNSNAKPFIPPQLQTQPKSQQHSTAYQSYPDPSLAGGYGQSVGAGGQAATGGWSMGYPAHHELLNNLPFYKYEPSVFTDLKSAAEVLGSEEHRRGPLGRPPKFFFGHVWSRVPTGVVQWLVSSFGPRDSTAFDPQLHFNKDGWFRGCLHTSIDTQDPKALIHALHKRVLFDHEGVWFAENDAQMKQLDDYCRRLRALPQQVRHQKLQSLPCNPLACELARNE